MSENEVSQFRDYVFLIYLIVAAIGFLLLAGFGIFLQDNYGNYLISGMCLTASLLMIALARAQMRIIALSRFEEKPASIYPSPQKETLPMAPAQSSEEKAKPRL